MRVGEEPGSAPQGGSSGGWLNLLTGAIVMAGMVVGVVVAWLVGEKVFGGRFPRFILYVGAGVGALTGGLICTPIWLAREFARGNADMPRCPSCQKMMSINPEFDGLPVTCPHCSHTFTAPCFNAEMRHCPGCQKRVRVPAEFAGLDVECPHCFHAITAPHPDEPGAGPLV